MNIRLNVSTLVAVVLLSIAVPVSAQLPFSNNFETGNLCPWNGCLTFALVGQPTVTWPLGGNSAMAEYSITVDITSTSKTLLIETEWGRGQFPDSSHGWWFVIENASGTYTSGSLPFIFLTLTEPLLPTDTPSHYSIPVGTTRRFQFRAQFNNAGAVPGSYRLRLVGVTYDQDGTDQDGDIIALFSTSFRTPTAPLTN